MQHAAWVRARQEAGSRARYVALDAIGDADATVANYRRQVAAGAVVEPTIHQGTPLAVLDEYAELNASGWVNAGGMVPMRPQDVPSVARFLAQVRLAAGDRYRVHGLGATHPGLAGVVPVDGVDSIYWLSTGRLGMLPLFDVRRGDWLRVHYNAKNPQARARGWQRMHEHGRWLRSEYGISPQELDRAPAKVARRLAIDSHRKYAAWLTARHGRPVTVYLAGAIGLNADDLHYIAQGNTAGAGNP